MKRQLLYGILLITALVLGACASGGAPAAVERSEAAQPAYDVAPVATMGVYSEEAPASSGGGDANVAQVERIVIQNADLSIVVADVELRLKDVQAMAEEMGGFVVSSSLYPVSYTHLTTWGAFKYSIMTVPSCGRLAARASPAIRSNVLRQLPLMRRDACS